MNAISEIRGSQDLVELDIGALISSRILRQLGRPRNLLQVQTRHLWGDHFRVNLLIEEGTGPIPITRIADSFFVTLSDEGLLCQPRITQKYPSAVVSKGA